MERKLTLSFFWVNGTNARLKGLFAESAYVEVIHDEMAF